MSDSWVKDNSRHPDNCQEYDVIFADVVGEKLAELEAKIERMSARGIEQLLFDNEKLEAELAALREAAREQRALLARFDAAPDVGKMLRDLHSALLQESSDE